MKQLTTYHDFERYKNFKLPISVYQEGELLDSNIIIQSHTDDMVISTQNINYLKSTRNFSNLRLYAILIHLYSQSRYFHSKIPLSNINTNMLAHLIHI